MIVGTNVIDDCKDVCDSDSVVPKEWQRAFVSSQQSRVGIVKSTNNCDITIQPMEKVTISRFVRKGRNVETAVTEQTGGASSKIGVCPRVVSLDKVGNSQRIPVRIFNMSAKVINIKPKSALCELHEVKLLRHVDFEEENEQNKVKANQQTVVEDTDDSQKQLPEGIH